ncbi:PREDICTED: uncharacterized protein LOC108747621 isoform X2 [Trachymyrmex septentrionalis]|uniref:uncharacterized protein LOC108747621 isoform X2 n=1 Tax=Trachymyrmex septentrionalis TaxID=34720 RepID=UPI00084EF339|nr:PREDICTED: uncharacterized protein LOC108747621 isoform X2 [Trachymyrmex septentrionalis]
MTKITIINCIIAAVCIFQTVEAGLLNKSLGSLLDTVQNQVSNTVENVKGLGKEGIQNGKLTDGLVAPQTGLSTSTSCTNAGNIIQEAAEQVMKIFDTCIVKTNSTEIKELIDATKSLQNVSKNFQDALNCIHDQEMVQCLTNVKGKIVEIMTKIINTASKSLGTVVNNTMLIRQCLKSGILQLTNQVMSQIVQHVEECLQSWTFTLPFKL